MIDSHRNTTYRPSKCNFTSITTVSCCHQLNDPHCSTHRPTQSTDAGLYSVVLSSTELLFTEVDTQLTAVDERVDDWHAAAAELDFGSCQLNSKRNYNTAPTLL